MIVERIATNSVVFREDLYPRIAKDPKTVQEYAEDLSVLPPIELNQHKELIDGWHRWTAHKKVQAETVPYFVTETKSDAHFLELAVKRNATFGLRLNSEDKKNYARKIYHVTPEREREQKKKDLCALLSVSERTVRGWLSRIDKDTKEARNKRIFAAWLACYTQEEIAEREGVTKETVSTICQEMADLPESDKPVAHHLVDFEPRLYNVWKFREKTEGCKHPGNSEIGILDQLLYKYTKPFDVVLDPFAGGGSTIDLCKKRYRRYWVSDRKVIPERAEEIREWDISTGTPSLPRWKDVALVYLDPPYWKQVEGRYSQDTTDLANMPLDEFTEVLSFLIIDLAGKLHTSSHIALLMQPTQWNAPDRLYIDHPADMMRLVHKKLGNPVMRVQCPYESQQVNAQMNEWAKTNKEWLVLSRELIIWQVK